MYLVDILEHGNSRVDATIGVRLRTSSTVRMPMREDLNSTLLT
jgi:hypothetical protein